MALNIVSRQFSAAHCRCTSLLIAKLKFPMRNATTLAIPASTLPDDVKQNILVGLQNFDLIGYPFVSDCLVERSLFT